MSTEDHFTSAAALWMGTNGRPATHRAKDGAVRPVLAVLDRNSAEVGDYGVTVATRPAIDVLTSDFPQVEQGSEITFAEGDGWALNRIASSDGYITRIWVEAK